MIGCRVLVRYLDIQSPEISSWVATIATEPVDKSTWIDHWIGGPLRYQGDRRPSNDILLVYQVRLEYVTPSSQPRNHPRVIQLGRMLEQGNACDFAFFCLAWLLQAPCQSWPFPVLYDTSAFL